MSDRQKWPDTLWIVRHGESAGNVARDAAYAAGRTTIGIAANHRPSAADCRSPSAESGTSTSRVTMSMWLSPAAWAASRATLPALSPWRTIQRWVGQRRPRGRKAGCRAGVADGRCEGQGAYHVPALCRH